MNLKINIENYKAIKSTEINLKKGLNILIGPNASGKTCILSAFKFIKDVLLRGSAQALAIAGGPKRVYRRRSKYIKFMVTYNYGDRIFRRRKCPFQLNWKFTIAQRGPEEIATIIDEKIDIIALCGNSSYTVFKISVNRKNSERPTIRIYLSNHTYFGKDLFSLWKYQYTRNNKQETKNLFIQQIRGLVKEAKKNSDRSFFPMFAKFDTAIENLFSNFVYMNEYNIIPDVARQATEQLQFAQMRPNGASVSEVIYALENKHYHKLERINRYEEFDYMIEYPQIFRYPYHIMPRGILRVGGRIKPYYRIRSGISGGAGRTRPLLEVSLENINRELSAAVRPLISVSAKTDSDTGRRFIIFKTDKEEFFPEEVSDGTIKWLCILVSVFVPYSRVYLLEEPENFLHPWMQQRLVNIMREQSKQHDTIFILTSHSSSILNAAMPDEIIIVTATKAGSVVKQIEDLQEIKRVLQESGFRLGDLWVSGVIGGVPAGE